MSSERTRAVTTTDGVVIGGAVHGVGPPLVLLQGIIGDGDIDWRALLPYLTGRFTCHLPSLRGRGLSGDHPDLSPGRAVGDVVAYVDGIGEPIGLVGWSYGAGLALAVAARSAAVGAVAPFEPVMPRLLDQLQQAVFGEAVARTGELAAGGELAAAARAFAGFPFNDVDIAMAEQAGYFEAAGRYVPNLLGILQQVSQSEDVTSDAVLAAVTASVMSLYGSETKPFLVSTVRYVAEHVAKARIQVIPGAGHAAPLTHPKALADALTEFFSPAQEPA